MKTHVPNVLVELSADSQLAPRWAHPKQAVSYSGLGTTFLYGLIRDGAIESVRISKNNKSKGRALRLIDLRSLDAWIETHRKQKGVNGK